MTIAAVLFDKDGTLFDFEASWADWVHALIADLSGGAESLASEISSEIRFDRAARRFAPDSPIIAGTLDEICQRIAPLLPGTTAGDLAEMVNARAAVARMVPATPLAPLLAELRGRGLALGVATNAAESEAMAHLEEAGIAAEFDYVAGCDSGFGAKPAPGMCTAFAKTLALDPGQVLMVGDSLHDLVAGRAAGMRTLAVLTGLATEADLGPHAEAVLPHIGHLPDWLGTPLGSAEVIGADARR